MTIETPNIISKVAEKTRGFKDGFQLFETLRAKWPKAFPLKLYEIRPLASSVTKGLIDEFGWTPYYAKGVLAAWKMRYPYCQAILHHPTRINLDGSVSNEEITDDSREQAKRQIARHAARRAKKIERAEQDRLCAAAKANAEPRAPAPENPSILTPAENLMPAALPKSSKLLVAGSAAMQAALKRRLTSGAMTTEVLKTIHAATPNGRRKQRTQ